MQPRFDTQQQYARRPANPLYPDYNSNQGDAALLDHAPDRYFQPTEEEVVVERRLSPAERRQRIIIKARRLGKIAFVDASTIARGSARDAALEQYRREMAGTSREQRRGITRTGEEVGFGRRVTNWAKGFWKGNIAREYYQERGAVRNTAAALQARDVHYGQGYDELMKQQENTALAERFAYDAHGLINEDMGERRIALAGTDDNRYHEGINQIKSDIIMTARRYVENGARMSPADLQNEIQAHGRRLVEYSRSVQGLAPDAENDIIDSGQVFVSNIMKMVRVLQEARDHQISFDELGIQFDLVLGRARSAIVETHQASALEKLKRSKFGVLVGNETVIPAALVVAGNILARKVAYIAGAASGVGLIAGVAASGAIAYHQEKGRVAGERVEDTRASARGRNLGNAGGPARGGIIEGTILEMRSASELTSQMNQGINDLVRLESYENIDQLDPEVLERLRYEAREKFENAVSWIADAEIRLKLLAGNEAEQQAGRQMIGFSYGKEHGERLALTLALARAKENIETYARDEENAAVLNYQSERDGSIISESIEDRMHRTYTTAENRFNERINDRDAAALKLGRRLAAGKATRTVLFGAVIGAAAQEALAFGSDNTEGLLERAVYGHNPYQTVDTMANNLANTFTGTERIIGHDIHNSMFISDGLPGHQPVELHLPKGFHYSMNSPGDFRIIDDLGNPVVDHFKPVFNPDGTLSPVSVHELRAMPTLYTSELHNAPSTTLRGFDAIRGEIQNRMQFVNITDHWDNNTGATFDAQGNVLNFGAEGSELQLEYGGHNGTGITVNPDGSHSYSMTVRHMLGMDATDGGQTLHLKDVIQNGHCKVMLYPGMEDHVHGVHEGVLVDVSPNGDINFPHGSAAEKFLSEGADGKLQWHGQMIVLEEHADGTYSTIARQFGDNWDSVTKTIQGNQILDIATKFDEDRGLQGAYLPIMRRSVLNPSTPPLDRRPWNPTVPEQSGRQNEVNDNPFSIDRAGRRTDREAHMQEQFDQLAYSNRMMRDQLTQISNQLAQMQQGQQQGGTQHPLFRT